MVSAKCEKRHDAYQELCYENRLHPVWVSDWYSRC